MRVPRWKRDTTFRKPSMNKEEIAKKVASLASKIKNNVEVRKVILLSGETGCGKTTQVTKSLLCLLYDLAGLEHLRNMNNTVSRILMNFQYLLNDYGVSS
ncbi:hypothetical protein ACFX1T_024388 [Malus domestica]